MGFTFRFYISCCFIRSMLRYKTYLINGFPQGSVFSKANNEAALFSYLCAQRAKLEWKPQKMFLYRSVVVILPSFFVSTIPLDIIILLHLIVDMIRCCLGTKIRRKKRKVFPKFCKFITIVAMQKMTVRSH